MNVQNIDYLGSLATIINSKNNKKVRFDLTQNIITYHDTKSKNDLTELKVRNHQSLSPSSISHVKRFMNRVLFGNQSSDNDEVPCSDHDDNKIRPMNKNYGSLPHSSLPLESTPISNEKDDSFEEDIKISNLIEEIVQKGKKAQYSTFHYPTASKCYLEAMTKLDQNLYPETHNLRAMTLSLLNDTHHSMRILEHSSDIVKLGLKYEEKGEFVKALKMYTVAFRMRRDAMGKNHHSLPVLLNMLGSVQMKRGEISEAMQIFELALYGRLGNDNMRVVCKTNVRASARAVSLREMGKIHEMKGDDDEAIEMFHKSLECVITPKYNNHDHKKINDLHDEIRLLSASTSKPLNDDHSKEMEVYIIENRTYTGRRSASNLCAFYDMFFQNEEIITSKSVSVNMAMTLHHVANIHCRRCHYDLALASFKASLRGMKVGLCENHPNVAAVQGNIGNLYKEMKNFDLAYEIYQDVLKIECQNLGVAHPELVVTMHNIAMIEKCRGNFKNSKRWYHEVIAIQLGRQERSIKWCNSTAVSYACLGDVYERDGDCKGAIAAYKEALNIRSLYTEKFHPDLGKLIHKIGVLHSVNGQFRDAAIYFAKALRLYEFNKINDSRVTAVLRSQADVLGKIAFNTSTI